MLRLRISCRARSRVLRVCFQFAATPRPPDLTDETLNNVACVVMSLRRIDGGEPVVPDARIVMKVADSDANVGVFTRSIFNPLLST